MSNLKNDYLTSVIPKLTEEFKYKNKHQIPKIEKIQVSAGLGLNAQNRVFLQKATEEIRLITGQHPVLTLAKKSIAGFKVREGMPLGASMTLRGEKMYEFLDRLISISLPRVRDFRGVSSKGFDGKGNYTLGLKEQIMFPEINYDKNDKIRGLGISIVTTAETNDEGRELLTLIGMPFRK